MIFTRKYVYWVKISGRGRSKEELVLKKRRGKKTREEN